MPVKLLHVSLNYQLNLLAFNGVLFKISKITEHPTNKKGFFYLLIVRTYLIILKSKKKFKQIKIDL